MSQVQHASVGLSTNSHIPAEIQTCEGTVDGVDATFMLDSGCNTVGIKRSLVSPSQIVDRKIRCRLFSGDVIEFPVAEVHLDCPYFSGTVDACILDNPICDVILGRIPGATFHCVQLANAVQTRAQKLKADRPFRPILTAKVPQLDIDPVKLITLQKEDNSLSACFSKVGQPRVSNASFHLRDGLLYRSVLDKNSDTVGN